MVKALRYAGGRHILRECNKDVIRNQNDITNSSRIVRGNPITGEKPHERLVI